MRRLTNAENVEPLLIMFYCGMRREPGKVPLMRKHTGVCVECVNDCECGVDEYCGYDYKDGYDKDKDDWVFDFKVKVPPGITSSNTGSSSGVMDNMRKEIELHAMQFEGLPIRHTRARTYTQHESHTHNVKSQSLIAEEMKGKLSTWVRASDRVSEQASERERESARDDEARERESERERKRESERASA